ncbi:MAG TPA: hypothetical protein VGH80_01195 [Xanthomonadaceae bacterium]
MLLKTEQHGNMVHFQLYISRAEGDFGWVEGRFNLKGANGTYAGNEYGPCEIDFTFAGSSVEIGEPQEKSECGFGWNVFASGTLHRTSTRRPKFAPYDARQGMQ